MWFSQGQIACVTVMLSGRNTAEKFLLPADTMAMAMCRTEYESACRDTGVHKQSTRPTVCIQLMQLGVAHKPMFPGHAFTILCFLLWPYSLLLLKQMMLLGGRAPWHTGDGLEYLCLLCLQVHPGGTTSRDGPIPLGLCRPVSASCLTALLSELLC